MPRGIHRVLVVTAVLLVGAGAASLSAADVTGTWTLNVYLDAGSGSPTFALKQEGDTITGTYEGQFGVADIKGTITGDAIAFSFDFEGGTATYTGTVSGNTMKGTCEYGGLASGTFEGEKVE